MFEHIGEFDVVSGQVRISDPCYDLEVSDSLAGTLPAENGRWEASVLWEEAPNGRISCLQVLHTGWTGRDWQYLPFAVGVDSGQAGVFDLSHYLDELVAAGIPIDNPIDADAPWYSLCCDRTLSQKGAGVIPFGTVASSGYGDGSYPAKGLFTADGRLVGVLIDFIEEDEEEWDRNGKRAGWMNKNGAVMKNGKKQMRNRRPHSLPPQG